jgi:hypothetical protein
MYIPLTYWESQADTLAQTNAKFCVFGALQIPQTISYNYETNPFSYTFTVNAAITNICQDTIDQSAFYKPFGSSGLMMLTSQPYFCSATITSSAGIPSTCCVNTPPNTGPEAWYIDIEYVGAFDNGTFYFYYINQYGDLVNDTITFAQGTKRIVSQTAAFWIKNREVGYTNFLNWNLISKFPGQVIPYAYKDIPAKYTFTLKRLDPTGGVANFNNYNYQTIGSLGLSGSLVSQGSASIGTQLNISSYNVPMANSSIYYNPPNAEVSVSPQPKTAFQLVSCQTTNSLWITLNNYDFYTTGSVLKVTNTQLTSTSSCWTVNNLTSSLSVSVSLTDVNVTQSYSAGFCTNCLGFTTEVIATGGTTGSFLSGSTLYKYNSFTTDGTFSIVSGSITDGKLMVIAGGGGGGNPAGGGAGGLVYSSSVSMANATSYDITVGTGGAAYNGTLWNLNAANGTNSIFSGSGYNVIATGGGAGASLTGTCTGPGGGNGGSGGGGHCGAGPGTGISGQGNNGGPFGTIGVSNYSGGGGGAGSAGQVRYGGAGIELGSVMINVPTTYSVGGGSLNGDATSTIGSGGKGGSGTIVGQTGFNGLVVITYPAFS